WSRLSIGLRQRSLVEDGDALAEVATLAVNRRVPPGDQAVEIRSHRFRRPVTLRPGEVGRCPAIERGQGAHFGCPQTAAPAGCGTRQQFFEAVPLPSPAADEFIGAHLSMLTQAAVKRVLF